LQCGVGESSGCAARSAIVVHQTALRMANCRLLHAGGGPAIRLDEARPCRVKNSLMYSAEGSVIDGFALRRAGTVLAENCIFSGFCGFVLQYDGGEASENSVELHNNTFFLREAIRFHLNPRLGQAGSAGTRVFAIKSTGNVFDTDGAVATVQPDWTAPADIERIARANRGETSAGTNPLVRKATSARTSAMLTHLKKVIAWHDEKDLYCGSGVLFAVASSQGLEGAHVAMVGPGYPYEKWQSTVDYHT